MAWTVGDSKGHGDTRVLENFHGFVILKQVLGSLEDKSKHLLKVCIYHNRNIFRSSVLVIHMYSLPKIECF